MANVIIKDEARREHEARVLQAFKLSLIHI